MWILPSSASPMRAPLPISLVQKEFASKNLLDKGRRDLGRCRTRAPREPTDFPGPNLFWPGLRVHLRTNVLIDASVAMRGSACRGHSHRQPNCLAAPHCAHPRTRCARHRGCESAIEWNPIAHATVEGTNARGICPSPTENFGRTFRGVGNIERNSFILD